MNYLTQKIIERALAIVAVFGAALVLNMCAFAIEVWFFELLWDHVMPGLFGAKPISYSQAFWLLLLGIIGRSAVRGIGIKLKLRSAD